MRADERQAGAAYTYAWWLTGDDDAAVAAIRAAFAGLADADERGERPLTVLMQGVRTHLGDVRPMCAASELALLHDGLEVDLGPAAGLAGISAEDITVQLAHGRLEGLLETVREEFDHPERLGGLAVGNPPDIAHARQCPSCARARTLVERGRAELREVVAVSPPAGLLAELVGGAAVAAPRAGRGDAVLAPAAEDAVAAPPESDRPSATDIDAPSQVAAADTPATADIDAPVDVAAAAQTDERTETGQATAADELPPPSGEELLQRPALLRPQPPPRTVPTTPARRRTAGILAAVGLVTLFALVTALFAMGGPSRTPLPQAEQPAVTDPTPGVDPDDDEPANPEPSDFGPQGEDTGAFTIADAGLLRSGDDSLAPQGVEVDPTEPLRLAVDYRNAIEGVPVNAVWRVEGETFLRLNAVLASRSSRHVWGLPVPPNGWPPGDHRVLITTDEGLAAAIDFSVSADA